MEGVNDAQFGGNQSHRGVKQGDGKGVTWGYSKQRLSSKVMQRVNEDLVGGSQDHGGDQ